MEIERGLEVHAERIVTEYFCTAEVCMGTDQRMMCEKPREKH